MIKPISLEEFNKILSTKVKLIKEHETKNLMSLIFVNDKKRRFIVHVSKVYEIIKED